MTGQTGALIDPGKQVLTDAPVVGRKRRMFER
jgi:hypothetical protein